jgi:hypothetical protein
METDKPVKSNSRKSFKYRGTECLNCGHPLDLSDRYCSYCSQLNTKKQLSLKDFLEEFIGSVLVYDSRLRYTLKDLLFKPGTITKNYVNGQRLKYANPFRFFLSVSIVYFLLQSLLTTLAPGANPFVNFNKNGNNVSLDSIGNQNVIFTNDEGKKDTLKLTDRGVVLNKDTLSKKEEKSRENFKLITEVDLDTLQWGNRIVTRFTLYRDFYELHEIKDASVALDSMNHKNTSFNRWVYNKNSAIDRISEDPFGFVNYLMGKIPFFLFFFTPICAVFFWLLYSKSQYTYMEHMVFIFHIFSFIFLAMLIALLPDMLIGQDVFSSLLFGIIGPFYFYKALRNFYKQNRLITIIKFVFLNIIFWFSSTIAAVLFFAVTAATY